MKPPIVRLKQGYVEGKIDVTENGFDYYSFQGMRYAKAPTLENRFMNPKAAGNWSGVYNATYERDHCLQMNSLNNVIGNEDCLFINVHTPKIPNSFVFAQILLPVMVWIHGGGFISGSGDSFYFGPDYIIENNVILVTMNYRLGVMGFMNLGIENASGNAGLKDQVMALKWVQENIDAFGGDTNKVTIFGESTGGASVQYLMLSSMSKGLFHKAIAHSGSCLSSWSFVSENINMFERAFTLANMIGKASRNATELLEILQSYPPNDLVLTANKMRTFDDKMRDAAFVFAPSVEKQFANSENFLTQIPIKILLSGNFYKCLYASGYNSKEGIYYINYARHNKGHIETLNRNFQFVVPSDMNLEMDSNDSIEVARLLKKFYFHDEDINDSTMPSYIDLYTDYAFLYKIIQSLIVIKHFSTDDVYFYKFDFDGDFNYFKKQNNLNYSGACHLDDLGYLFREYVNADENEGRQSVSKIVRNRMVTLWTNFAKFGNPTPSTSDVISTIWKPITHTKLYYLKITNDLQMKINPELKRMRFWIKLYKTFSNYTIGY